MIMPPMKDWSKALAPRYGRAILAACVAALGFAALATSTSTLPEAYAEEPAATSSTAFSDEQKKAIGEIVKDYLTMALSNEGQAIIDPFPRECGPSRRAGNNRRAVRIRNPGHS